MKKKPFTILMILFVCFSMFGQEVNYPFPQNIQVDLSHVNKPGISLDSMNADVRAYYEHWKYGETRMDPFLNEERFFPGYLQETATIPGGFYVKMIGQGDHTTPAHKSTNEAIGYGMIFSVLMADGQPDSKGRFEQEIFDGFYTVVKTFPSQDNNGTIISEYQMSWVFPASENPAEGQWTASDGELDIAYALLLAHDQWGSKSGKFNYKEEALKRIAALEEFTIDTRFDPPRINTGNWFDPDQSIPVDEKLNSCHPNHTRPCDWMLTHTVAFYHATGNKLWYDVTEGIFEMTEELQSTYAPVTGLVPDFAYNNPGEKIRPVNPVVEGPIESGVEVDQYHWNSCRFPWRHTMGYIHYKDDRAKANVSKIIDWLLTTITDEEGTINYDAVRAGYRLNGEEIVSYGGHAFTAPFMLAMTVDTKYQEALDIFWNNLSTNFESDWPEWTWWSSNSDPARYKELRELDSNSGYYSDTINLFCLLGASGNYWQANQWDVNRQWYNVGDYVVYKGVQYKCTFSHWSQVDYYPGAPGLWFWEVQ